LKKEYEPSRKYQLKDKVELNWTSRRKTKINIQESEGIITLRVIPQIKGENEVKRFGFILFITWVFN
jgi:hypothetical protein